jgi:hypothetical protein
VSVVEDVPVNEDTPVVEDVDVPIVEDVPVVRHGKLDVALGTTLVVGTVNRGLRPPAPSSLAPIGIPTRPTADTEPIPVGDEADAAGPAKELLPIVGQVPDAVPAMPPPSNTVVDSEVPVVEVPVADDVPAVELPVADAATELARVPTVPNDDCGIEPPMPLHAVLITVVVDASDVIIGLVPAPPIPVAPRGMRVGGTGEPGPMPSGDVMPSGETCATAEPHPKSTATVAAIIKRVIVESLYLP